MKKIVFLFIFLLPLSAFSRSPAVEPISGISIDQYNEVSPSKAQGFSWSDKKKENRVNTDDLPTQEINTTDAKDLTPAAVLFFMLLAPFGIWFFLLGKLDTPEIEIGFQDEQAQDPENMLAFPKKSQKDSDDEDDDFDIPKAS